MPFHGADDLMQEDRRIGVGGWLLGLLGMLAVIAVLIASFATNAHAQAGQPSDCSGTATSTAAAITYPTSGATGPTSPSQFVTVANPSATANSGPMVRRTLSRKAGALTLENG